MGLFSTKTKTTATMTPNNPPWVTDPSVGIFGQLASAGAVDPKTYIAPANDSLLMADQKAQGLGSDYYSLFGDAAGGIKDLLGGSGASASSAQLGDVSKYFNPFQKDVVASTLDTLNRQGDRTIQNAKLAYAGPNWGDNAAVTEALTRGEVQSGINNAVSGLNLQGWNSAAGLAENQAGRDQQTNLLNAQLAQQERAQKLGALGQLGQLGGLFGSNQRADIGTLSDTGGTLQSIDQARAGAPITVPGDIASIIAQLGPLFQGQTTTGTSKSSGGIGNLLLANAAKGAAALAGGGG